jgi:hypothetical protein
MLNITKKIAFATSLIAVCLAQSFASGVQEENPIEQQRQAVSAAVTPITAISSGQLDTLATYTCGQGQDWPFEWSGFAPYNGVGYLFTNANRAMLTIPLDLEEYGNGPKVISFPNTTVRWLPVAPLILNIRLNDRQVQSLEFAPFEGTKPISVNIPSHTDSAKIEFLIDAYTHHDPNDSYAASYGNPTLSFKQMIISHAPRMQPDQITSGQ